MDHKFSLFEDKKKKLMHLLQREFPLISTPYLHLAELLEVEENEVLNILKTWQEEGKLRQISAIFSPSHFQHKSSLFAFRVPKEKLKKAIEAINAHPGVSHNYLRNYEYNLWFTLVVPPEIDLIKEAEELFKKSEARDFLYLPILKTFKIAVIFENENQTEPESPFLETKEIFTFSKRDIELVKALQEPLPIISEPFKGVAEKLNITEKEIFAWLNEMKKKGALRRFAGLFKHHKLGYKKNIMVAWLVPEDRLKEVVKKLCAKSYITHCYLRKCYPHFPYNLYTMCHFREDGLTTIQSLSQELKLTNYLALETIQELKKIRLKLFYTKN